MTIILKLVIIALLLVVVCVVGSQTADLIRDKVAGVLDTFVLVLLFWILLFYCIFVTFLLFSV